MVGPALVLWKSIFFKDRKNRSRSLGARLFTARFGAGWTAAPEDFVVDTGIWNSVALMMAGMVSQTFTPRGLPGCGRETLPLFLSCG